MEKDQNSEEAAQFARNAVQESFGEEGGVLVEQQPDSGPPELLPRIDKRIKI